MNRNPKRNPNRFMFVILMIVGFLYFAITLSYAEDGNMLLIQQLNNTIIIVLLVAILVNLRK